MINKILSVVSKAKFSWIELLTACIFIRANIFVFLAAFLIAAIASRALLAKSEGKKLLDYEKWN